MDFLSPLWGILKDLWGLASKPLGYICNPKKNVDSLQNATKDLKAKREDVTKKVKIQEQGGGAQRTNEVTNWLGKVQEFEGRVDPVLEGVKEPDQIKCLSRCLPQNCRSSYKLGKKVDQLLNEARELERQQAAFREIMSPLPPPKVLKMPTGDTVGLHSSLDEVWEWLMDEKGGVIGLYGTGGVGKTTLMTKINNKLSRENHGFEVVIWVVVSRQVNEDSIQDTIRKRLNIEDSSWDQWSQEERVHHLFEDLTQKKFVLLIDDVWARLDLSKIGVPSPDDLQNGSKVVFTTRSEQVCHQMQATKTFEVKCLTPEEALALFENNVGKPIVDSNPEITELAKDIVQECKGLPLAIITVGRAMAGVKNSREWEHALTTLRKNPYKLEGMENEVYHILELSYDRLDDSSLQSCFLYCCLFPEDYRIRPHDLIGHWIGERLLSNADDVYSSRNEGECFLGRLIRACLLETGEDEYGRKYVKMHDVLRDMAIWITRDRGRKENKLLVIEKEEDISEEMISNSKWREAKKVCLWGQWIKNIDRIPPPCSQVETLFVRVTRVKSLPRGFFESMKARLMVLDLSGNYEMTSFPEEICELIELRYLNLSGTGIRELPMKIKKLTRLRWLLLDEIHGPSLLIPKGAIASLPLIVFSYWSESFIADIPGIEKEEEMVEELGRMQHLTDLSIHVCKSASAQKIFKSPNLRRRIRRAEFDHCEGLTSIEISGDSPGGRGRGGGGFSHLEELWIVECHALRKMEIAREVGRAPISSCFPSLVRVHVGNCDHLEDLSCLMHAPNLRRLCVFRCQSIKRIVGDEYTGEELAASGLFSRLQTLRLRLLPKLRSICDQTLSFPQRVAFDIIGCPGVRQLPLDSNSASGRSFQVTAYTIEWWERFEWDPVARVRVTLHLLDNNNRVSVEEEMTFGEAVRKLKDEGIIWTWGVTMEFGA